MAKGRARLRAKHGPTAAKAAPRRWLGRLFGRRLARAGAGLVIVLALWLLAWRVLPLPGGPYMAAEWWRLGGIEREWRDLEEISPDLARSVVAAEDARFCAHWGIDLDAIGEAIEERERGRVRGASTITQQVVKNVFLWHGASWLRKGLEAALAPVVELAWGKRRILEIYLNVAEFGEGVFGAEAAARHHFGRPASGLTPQQAARLAVILPNPKARNPNRLAGWQARHAGRVAEGARTLAAERRDACFRRR